MFHTEYFPYSNNAGPVDSRNTVPDAFDPPNPFSVPSPHSFEAAQQSGPGYWTNPGLDGESITPQDFSRVPNTPFIFPESVTLGMPMDLTHNRTCNSTHRPQAFSDLSIYHLPDNYFHGSQRLTGCSSNALTGYVPTAQQPVASDLPPSSRIRSRVPGCRTPDYGAKPSDIDHCHRALNTRQPNKRKVEKVRRPARRRKDKNQACDLGAREISQVVPPQIPGQQSPDYMTICSFYIWMAKKPGTMPTEHEMSCFSLLFGDSFETVRNWFLRNGPANNYDDDTGYQTMTSSSIDIASACRRRQGRCIRKANKLHCGNKNPVRIQRSEARPYACTFGCGKDFNTKDGWKRHEKISRPPEIWLCHLQGCQNKGKCMYFRRDKFGQHIRRSHPTIKPTKTVVASCCVPIHSNFSRRCIFSYCDVQFQARKERIDHIAKHFENDVWDASQWRLTDVQAEGHEDSIGDDSDSSDSERSNDSDGNDDVDSDSDDDTDGDNDNNDNEDRLGYSNDRRGSDPDRRDRAPGPSNKQRGGRSPKRRNGEDFNKSNRNRCDSFGHTSTPSGMQKDSIYNQSPSLSGTKHFPSSPGASSASFKRNRTIQKTLTQRCFVVEANLGPLGHGQNACVYEVKVKGYKGTMARKTACHLSTQRQHKLHREATIMARFNHPHITRLVASCDAEASLTLFMLPVADCNLSQYLNACSSGHFGGEEMLDWFNCLSSGLRHLHERGVRHRDIKPSNILVKNKTVLFSDFGSSNVIAEDASVTSESADFTERYAAPEIHQGRRGRAADIWALGCVFVEMMARLLPRPTKNPREERRERKPLIESPAIHQPNGGIPKEWIHTLRREAAHTLVASNLSVILDSCEAMLRERPEQRPTAAEISEKFVPLPCCSGIRKDGLSMIEKSEPGLETLEADTSGYMNGIPHLIPDLDNGSDASTLSDLDTIGTASLTSVERPKASVAQTGRENKYTTTIGVNKYSLPLDVKVPYKKMIDREWLAYDPLEQFLVSGISQLATRSTQREKQMRLRADVYDHENGEAIIDNGEYRELGE